MVKYHLVETVSGCTLTHMREWLSWWSTTLPRSGPRVRVPSRALQVKRGSTLAKGVTSFCLRRGHASNVRGLHFVPVVAKQRSTGPPATSRAL